MKNFDPDMITELSSEILSVYFLAEFQFGITYYYTDNDVPIYYNGNKYLPLGFSFNEISYSSSMAVDRVTIDINNMTKVFSAIVLNEDVRNDAVILYFGVRMRDTVGLYDWASGISWDTNTAWETRTGAYRFITEEIFRGIVGGWKIKGDSIVSIDIANELIMWNKKTLRNHSPSCPWTLGCTECGYTGTQTWCDQTYDRCLELSNTDNFGGNRFLPSLEEKEIWWGRTQKI